MSIAMTPSARREAERRKIDIRQIQPTGIGGYIQLADVLRFSAKTDQGARFRITPLANEVAKRHNLSTGNIPAADGRRITKEDVLNLLKQSGAERTIPHSEMRRVIARRMARSISEVPQYTMFGEYDATALTESMDAYAAYMRAAGDVKPTLTDLLIYMTAQALRNNEILNSTFYEDRVVIHPQVNIGIAVALDDGLVVPNIKNADHKSLLEISRERSALVQKARKGRLLPDDYAGGTFTITNLGQFPVLYSTPIINQPESAILGVGMLADKPAVYMGRIETRKMLSISLTCDHRHIDGAKAAVFLSDFKKRMEHPEDIEQMCNLTIRY
jgi:pyruvate dehydrogenase E2 component (dihydrolipoamide acetyltransferase)